MESHPQVRPSGAHSPTSQSPRRLRLILAFLSVLVCCVNIFITTTQLLRHSRNFHRVLNKQMLLHDDLDIYWFGYREGQYLINYPIHEYYFVGEFAKFLQRMEFVLANLGLFSFGHVNQEKLNSTKQNIGIVGIDGRYEDYQWTIQDGISEPFNSTDQEAIKRVLVQTSRMEIWVTGLQMDQGGKAPSQILRWDILFLVQIFQQSSIFVSIILKQKISFGIQHIPHMVLGLMTGMLILQKMKTRKKHFTKTKKHNELWEKQQKFKYFRPSDLPDFLVFFFLVFSSFVSFTKMFTPQYVLLLDGITCFVCWLYILKLYTQHDDYHISFLIKKSYKYVGRLFISFGPLFIGFCMFALTLFCRYSTLFASFHKTFISIFCVCYYNMTYQQFRTTQRTNPISAIFFTTVLMIFTICIYSGMLVSVFCSYMWNKRQKKNKQQILKSLKIQCMECNNKYSYIEGYQTKIKMSIQKNLLQDTDDPNNIIKFRKIVREIVEFGRDKALEIGRQNGKIVRQIAEEEVAAEYFTWIREIYVIIENLKKQIEQVEDEEQ